MVEEYRKLVDADAAAKFAEKQFNAICNHYIAHLSKEEAIEKISEPYKIMKDYLPIDSNITNSFYNLFLQCLNQSDGLKKVYDYYLANISTSKGSFLGASCGKLQLKSNHSGIIIEGSYFIEEKYFITLWNTFENMCSI